MRAWRLSAAVLAAQKRVDEIPALLAAAEAAIPDDLSPWFAAGNNLMQHNVDLPRAETCLKRYIADTREPEVDAPPLAAAHRILALTYEKEGRKAEAIAELQTALRLKPDFEAAKQGPQAPQVGLGPNTPAEHSRTSAVRFSIPHRRFILQHIPVFRQHAFVDTKNYPRRSSSRSDRNC